MVLFTSRPVPNNAGADRLLMELIQIQRIIEAAVLAHGKPTSVDKLQSLFVEPGLKPEEQNIPDKATILAA